MIKLMTKRAWPAMLVLLSLCLMTPPSRATVITDPANDFIPTFTGTKSPDLDVLSVFATFDGAAFHIGATMAGNIGALPTALYVFGFNRGLGNLNFASIGLPGVVFDTVITMTGAGVVNRAGATSHITGATFTIDVPIALLPSTGFQPSDYGINLWPRDTAVAAGNAQISDFAPNSTTFKAVPEPASLVLLLGGLFGLIGWRRAV